MDNLPEQSAKLWQPVAAALLLHLALMALYVAKYNGDVTSLVACGTNWTPLPAYQQVSKPIGPNGHDGQFYFSIAQAPWRKHGEDLDLPGSRHLRIFYPAVCWLLSGGSPQLLFWVMPAVNLVAIGALAFVGGSLARYFGMNPWWGFAFPLALNAGLPALHDMTDLWGMLGIAWLLYAWLSRAPWWTMALATAMAILARDQNVAIAAIVLGFALWQRRFGAAGGIVVGLALFTGWVAYLYHLYGKLPFSSVPGNFDAPLSGIFFRLTHLGGNDHFSVRLSIIMTAFMIHLAIQLGLVCHVILRRQKNALLMLMTAAGALIALTGGNYLYRDFWTITRVFVWMPMGLWILALQMQRRWVLALLSFAVLWPIVAALRYV